MYELDPTDARILQALDEHRGSSVLDIARVLGISRNTVHARMKRLREHELWGADSRSVAPEALGKPLLAFVTLSVRQQQVKALYKGLAAIPEVVEAHTVTGNSDLLLRVVAEDTGDLHRITQDIQSLPGVQRSSTSIATTEVIRYRTSPLLTAITRR